MSYKVIMLMLLTLVGCAKDAQQVNKTTNKEFEVELLFENDGCKVYRFWDNRRYIYYTNCKGSTMHTESCGKNCTREVEVSTN